MKFTKPLLNSSRSHTSFVCENLNHAAKTAVEKNGTLGNAKNSFFTFWFVFCYHFFWVQFCKNCLHGTILLCFGGVHSTCCWLFSMLASLFSDIISEWLFETSYFEFWDFFFHFQYGFYSWFYFVFVTSYFLWDTFYLMAYMCGNFLDSFSFSNIGFDFRLLHEV